MEKRLLAAQNLSEISEMSRENSKGSHSYWLAQSHDSNSSYDSLKFIKGHDSNMPLFPGSHLRAEASNSMILQSRDNSMASMPSKRRRMLSNSLSVSEHDLSHLMPSGNSNAFELDRDDSQSANNDNDSQNQDDDSQSQAQGSGISDDVLLMQILDTVRENTSSVRMLCERVAALEEAVRGSNDKVLSSNVCKEIRAYFAKVFYMANTPPKLNTPALIAIVTAPDFAHLSKEEKHSTLAIDHAVNVAREELNERRDKVRKQILGLGNYKPWLHLPLMKLARAILPSAAPVSTDTIGKIAMLRCVARESNYYKDPKKRGFWDLYHTKHVEVFGSGRSDHEIEQYLLNAIAQDKSWYGDEDDADDNGNSSNTSAGAGVSKKRKK